jgi:RNA polymerase sigma-70 factor (ECF subfamily)
MDSPQLADARSAAAPTDVADPDAVLVDAAIHDRAAFGPLYQQYVDPIYGYCLSRLHDVEAAEDATAQIFTKALIALPIFVTKRGSFFRSWLFTIAHNVLVDTDRRHRPQQSLDAAARLIDPDPGPEHSALATETRDEVAVLLADIPPEQRRVLELRLAGLTGSEIAQVLGTNAAAVRAT